MIAGMNSGVVPDCIDRRLRVMWRFAQFCLILMDRLCAPSRKADTGDVLAEINAVCAAITLSKTAMMLIGYIKNPRPFQSHGHGADKPHRGNHHHDTEHPARFVLPDRTGVTAFVRRVARKGRDMIRRDRLYRFGIQSKPGLKSAEQAAPCLIGGRNNNLAPRSGKVGLLSPALPAGQKPVLPP